MTTRASLVGRSALAAAVAVTAGLLAVDSGSDRAPADRIHTVTVDGYPLSIDLAAAAAFTGTTSIVVATVESVGEARWNTADHARPAGFGAGPVEGAPLYQISSPVTVRIDDVLAGPLRAGDATVVRALGGERDGVRYEFEHQAPVSTYMPGSQVVLFLGELVNAGDGLSAATPNHVYVVDGALARYWSGEYAVPLSTLSRTVRAARVG